MGWRNVLRPFLRIWVLIGVGGRNPVGRDCWCYRHRTFELAKYFFVYLCLLVWRITISIPKLLPMWHLVLIAIHRWSPNHFLVTRWNQNESGTIITYPAAPALHYCWIMRCRLPPYRRTPGVRSALGVRICAVIRFHGSRGPDPLRYFIQLH